MASADLFNESWYLRSYPDVAAAVDAGVIDARTHFELYGMNEGRAPGPLFNPQFYLAQNPDVAAAVEQGLFTAYEHFVNYGMAEGRSPVAYFDEAFYLERNPDVAAAVNQGVTSAIAHFLQFGLAEDRTPVPWFDPAKYLAANADVAGGWDGSAFEHLLLYGVFEDRALGNGLRIEFYQNDPVFSSAMGELAFHDAVARVGAVAPFFRDFQGPPGWQPAPDTPIPIDFIPLDGMKLFVPPSVVVPDGMVLPDTFEPVNPPGPSPDPDPHPDPGPSPEPDPDCDCEDGDGTVCLEDGETHTVGAGDQRLVILADADVGSAIEISGYETYRRDGHGEYISGQIIDLSKVKDLAVYGTDDGRRLELTYGNDVDTGAVWDKTGSLVVSLKKGLEHTELTGAAGQLVDFYVGDKARSFGYEYVRADNRDFGDLLETAFGSPECGCLPEAEPLWGPSDTLLMGSAGMQVFLLGEGNLALGGRDQDVFVLMPGLWPGEDPAIIGDYSYEDLDIIELALSVDDPLDLLSLSVHNATWELNPISGLDTPAGANRDVEVRMGGEAILHIARPQDADEPINESILFTVAGGLVTATVNIAEGGSITSLYSGGSGEGDEGDDISDLLLPYSLNEAVFSFLTGAIDFDDFRTDLFDDLDLSGGSAGLVELLIGGSGQQTIESGQAVVSVLMGGSGDDKLTGHTGLDFYYGGTGNDSITLAGETSGLGVVVFGADADDNGEDTITNFTAGAEGDLLDFSLFLSGGDISFENLAGSGMSSMLAGKMGTLSGSGGLEPETGNDQILIVPKGTNVEEYIELEVAPYERYVVLRPDEEVSPSNYSIFFVEVGNEGTTAAEVAKLALSGGTLCDCNFSP